ncbi:PIG-L family deacetylase [Janibacter sp. Y6]|uniref:PIG-L family deacetylase n=1 Tax=Janibacter sp. Y6 TaxID=2913552 RepID=UPI0034A5D3BB
MTIVFLHAHPDDEASGTAGSMILASDAGQRVVAVYATGGELGTVPDGVGVDGLAAHRRAEAEASARVTGTARVEWLGYRDSGMHGWEQNSHDGSFHGADVDEAAGRLAAILDEEDADVLVGYDWHGGYGHPDHVQVHRVAHRAAELAARRPRLLEGTMNRDEIRRGIAAAKEMGMDPGWDADEPMADGEPIGLPQEQIHHRVDVTGALDRKRRALECHGSQEDVQGMLQMPPPAYTAMFGVEYYTEPGAEPGMVDGNPFV